MSYTLGDVQTSSKGIRSAPLTDSIGNPVFIVAQEQLSAPFGASAFNDPDATRKTSASDARQPLRRNSMQSTNTWRAISRTTANGCSGAKQ